MRRRVQIQPNNVGRLLLKIRIIRGHVAFYAVRLKAVLTPHPCHHHVADLQMRSEFARAPVGYSRRCVSRRLQNPRFQFRCQHGSDLPQMAAVESRDALLVKSSAPPSDKTPAAVDALRHFTPGKAFGQQQDQPCPPGIFGPSRPTRGTPSQFLKLRIRQGDRVSHGRDYSLQLVVTVLGEISRFTRARRLMGYGGIVASEHSSGESTQRGSITKTGNAHLRRVVVEAAWAYRHRPSIGETLRKRQERVSE